MCCNRRRNRQQVPVAVPLAGAAYNKYQQHKIQQQQPQNERSISQAILPYTIDQPASQQAPFELSGEKSSLLHQEDKASINPPSYDTVVVNRAIVPDNDPTAHMSPYATPILMNRRDTEGDAGSSISSVDSFTATLPQVGNGRRISSIEIPEGTTWWQAYRARKAERGEAKRAEKAGWKAEKVQWKAARRMAKGGC